jgi:hypothetical protein
MTAKSAAKTGFVAGFLLGREGSGRRTFHALGDLVEEFILLDAWMANG